MCICFPSVATVATVDGPKSIENLHKSKCPLLTFTPGGHKESTKKDTFLTFLHFEPETMATFLGLICENGRRLVISPEHLLFASTTEGSTTAIPANQVQIGHFLICINEQGKASLTKVIEIRTVEESGVFSPLSRSGTLLVDGFLVSCYAHVGNLTHATAHASFAPLRLWFSAKKRMSKLMLREKREAKIQKNPKAGIHEFAKGLINFRRILPI